MGTSTPKGWQRAGNERLGLERLGTERNVEDSKKMTAPKPWPMTMGNERMPDEYGDEIDLMDRDPRKLNVDAVKIDFVDVIAEPEGIHSIGIFWKASFITFTFMKTCVYTFGTTVFGIPLAGFWGFIFAIFSLFHIWFVVPTIKFVLIPVHWIGRIYAICISLFCWPLFEAIGKICSNIKVHNVSATV